MKKTVLMLLLAFTTIASSETEMEKLKTLFKNTQIVAVSDSQIPGLSQVLLEGSKVIYYHPESKKLIFGEIWNLVGENLTARVIAEAQQETLRHLPVEDSLTIGDEHGIELVEFTDPDCPYCKKLNDFLITADIPVKRRIFFVTSIHPDTAPQKALHILCSENPADSFRKIYNGETPQNLQDCSVGKKILDTHERISKRVGIKGTPTLLLDGLPVTGYRENVIANYLRKKQQQEVANNTNQQ